MKPTSPGDVSPAQGELLVAVLGNELEFNGQPYHLAYAETERREVADQLVQKRLLYQPGFHPAFNLTRRGADVARAVVLYSGPSRSTDNPTREGSK